MNNPRPSKSVPVAVAESPPMIRSRSLIPRLLMVAFLGGVSCSGCASPYYTDRGALIGGLTGAGAGALIGEGSGDALPGAVLGGALGAVAGGALGANMDEIEARNRARIEQQMARPVSAGAATIDDVIAMHEAGVDEELIVGHIRSHGVARRPQAADLIALQERDVPKRVISALQSAPPPNERVAQSYAPPPVIVEEHYWDGPYYRPYRHHHHHHPHPGWGFSYHHYDGW